MGVFSTASRGLGMWKSTDGGASGHILAQQKVLTMSLTLL